MMHRVLAFQQHHGLTANGVVGPRTWAKLVNAPGTDRQGYGLNTRQGNYWHDEDTIHDNPPPAVADPGREVVAAGNRYTIFPDEVRRNGSVTWRGRNPGAIGIGDKYGAYPGKKASAKNTEGLLVSVAVFPDENTGFEAIKTLVKE